LTLLLLNSSKLGFTNSGYLLLSICVESGYFSDVYINFLIVGHTHCPLDQTFSVVSRGLMRKAVILSPRVLYEVLKNAAKEPHQKPVVVKLVEKVFNFRDSCQYFINMVNKRIVLVVVALLLIVVIINIDRKQELCNYQWPHCFHIGKDIITGRAFTRYKMFSTDKSWIPDSKLTLSAEERCILSGGVDAVTRCITG
jgi:hypothetical protein